MNYVLAILSFVCGAKGGKATSSLYATHYVPIDASSISMEALTETCDMHGDEKGDHFENCKRLRSCQSFVFN